MATAAQHALRLLEDALAAVRAADLAGDQPWSSDEVVRRHVSEAREQLVSAVATLGGDVNAVVVNGRRC